MEGNYNVSVKKAEPSKPKGNNCGEWLLMILGIVVILGFMGFRIHLFGW